MYIGRLRSILKFIRQCSAPSGVNGTWFVSRLAVMLRVNTSLDSQGSQNLHNRSKLAPNTPDVGMFVPLGRNLVRRYHNQHSRVPILFPYEHQLVSCCWCRIETLLTIRSNLMNVIPPCLEKTGGEIVLTMVSIAHGERCFVGKL